MEPIAEVTTGADGAMATNGTAVLDPHDDALLELGRRADTAHRIRIQAAIRRRDHGSEAHPTNRDEGKYRDRNYCASFTKGLPHHESTSADGVIGEVKKEAYKQLLHALQTHDPADFAAIPLGFPPSGSGVAPAALTVQQTANRFAPAALAGPSSQRPLVNPQAALAYDLEGYDSHQLAIPPAPGFGSAEAAGEMIELYWMARARDVPFSQYGQEPLTQAAIADLNDFAQQHPCDYKGPHDPDTGERVSARTLFRGDTAGELVGPYISQFLLLDVPFGAQVIDQRINTVRAGKDYMTDFTEWLDIQQGRSPQHTDTIDPTPRYIRNGRDLGQYVHVDVLFQAYFNAMLLLLQAKGDNNRNTGLGATFDYGNPYSSGGNQEGFGTFGGPHVATLLCEVATRALKAVWFQKWAVHRRLRPEAYGGRLEALRLTHATRDRYDVHQAILDSDALQEALLTWGSHLLPMAFPEGSPVHPAYGAGHATVAGACVTVLKAWFDETQPMSALQEGHFRPQVPRLDPADAAQDGVQLEEYTGADVDQLTVGGELNKLAANIGIGRNHAGVHWRTDHTASIRLGEKIAIGVLEDQACTYNEQDFSFTFTTFDGDRCAIRPRRCAAH